MFAGNAVVSGVTLSSNSRMVNRQTLNALPIGDPQMNQFLNRAQKGSTE